MRPKYLKTNVLCAFLAVWHSTCSMFGNRAKKRGEKTELEPGRSDEPGQTQTNGSREARVKVTQDRPALVESPSFPLVQVA
jgi:hypothetical protein